MSQITMTNDLGTKIMDGNILCLPTADEACTTSDTEYLQEAVSVRLSVSARDYEEEVTRGVLTVHRVDRDYYSVHLTCLDLDCNFYFGSRWLGEFLTKLIPAADLEALEPWEEDGLTYLYSK